MKCKNRYYDNLTLLNENEINNIFSNNQNLNNLINEITDAKIEDGGSGAFYIFLKKNKSTK